MCGERLIWHYSVSKSLNMHLLLLPEKLPQCVLLVSLHGRAMLDIKPQKEMVEEGFQL